jgi:coronin-1B/1C/6
VGVLPLDKPGKRQGGVPMIHAHTARVVDLHFSPFNDNLLATGSEDCSVKVWEVPDDLANGSTYSTAKAQLKGHAKRVEMVKFHPVADNIVASASVDKTLRLWDINAQGTRPSSFMCLFIYLFYFIWIYFYSFIYYK